MPNSSFLANDAEVAHNDFDGETIVIHFPSGNYFSLRGSAAAIWHALTRGPAAAHSLLSLFDRPPADAESALAAFLDRLAAENLVVVSDAEPAPAAGAGLPYSPPTLEAFDDLQELLLADIIHDTGSDGWLSPGVSHPGSAA